MLVDDKKFGWVPTRSKAAPEGLQVSHERKKIRMAAGNFKTVIYYLLNLKYIIRKRTA